MFKRILTTTGVTLGAVALIATSAYADTINGTNGNDLLEGTAGADTINGFAGNDSVFAGSGADLIRGGNGADTLIGENGNDRIFGGPGNDELTDWQQDFGQHRDHDQMWGGDGNDLLGFTRGTDRVFGGRGNDTFKTHNEGAPDVIDCGPGFDVVTYAGARDTHDTLKNCERVRTS